MPIETPEQNRRRKDEERVAANRRNLPDISSPAYTDYGSSYSSDCGSSDSGDCGSSDSGGGGGCD